MAQNLSIPNSLLFAFHKHIGETIYPNQLGLDVSRDELIAACNLLVLFDLIENEGTGQEGFNRYRITQAGSRIIKRGGLKKYLEEINFG